MFIVSSERDLKNLLKDKKYLTSDNFINPDRSYLFLENNIIKLVDIGDIVSIFNFEVFRKSIFRIVERKYNNFEYEHSYS